MGVAVRLGIVVMSAACAGGVSGEGELLGFGEVDEAYLVPCTVSTEAGEVPTAFGYLQSRERTCGDGLDDFLGGFERLGCDEWDAASEQLQGCFSAASQPNHDVLTFHLAEVGDVGDLTGAWASWVQLNPCYADEPDAVPATFAAELTVLADHGETAELRLASEPAWGRVTARVCRR